MYYSISSFAKQTELSAYTLRYYEKLSLLMPIRSANGRRCYSERDLQWIAFIKRLKETGMPLKEIQHYAMLRAQGNATLAARKAMLELHKNAIIQHMNTWQNHLDNLNQKLDYYQDAIDQTTCSSS